MFGTYRLAVRKQMRYQLVSRFIANSQCPQSIQLIKFHKLTRAGAFKSSNANISNIFDKKNATLKKIATSSTLNSYGGKSSSVYSRLTNTTNNSSPRRSQQNTVKITANSSNDAANRFKSASLQSSLLAKRQSTCLSLNNDETIQDKRKVSMTTSSTNGEYLLFLYY